MLEHCSQQVAVQHEHVMVQAGDTRLQGPQCLEQPVNMPSCTICLGIYLDRHEKLACLDLYGTTDAACSRDVGTVSVWLLIATWAPHCLV